MTSSQLYPRISSYKSQIPDGSQGVNRRLILRSCCLPEITPQGKLIIFSRFVEQLFVKTLYWQFWHISNLKTFIHSPIINSKFSLSNFNILTQSIRDATKKQHCTKHREQTMEWQHWNECWQQLQYNGVILKWVLRAATMEMLQWTGSQPRTKHHGVVTMCTCTCMLTVAPSLGALLLFALLPRTPHVRFYCKAFNISTVMLLWSRTWGAQAQTRHQTLGEVFGPPSTGSQ